MEVLKAHEVTLGGGPIVGQVDRDEEDVCVSCAAHQVGPCAVVGVLAVHKRQLAVAVHVEITVEVCAKHSYEWAVWVVGGGLVDRCLHAHSGYKHGATSPWAWS